MIRFIACDLDGTLLDGTHNLPGEIFGIVSQLHARGILFAPASGRQYANLELLFAPVKDKAVFISENGALVKYRGKTLMTDPVPDGHIAHALAVIREAGGLRPVLCGADSAYIEDRSEPFFTYATGAYTRCVPVPSLEGVIGREPICKIAVFDEQPAAEHCIRLLPPRLPALKTTLSGTDWCDVSSPTAGKGEAIRFLRETFGLHREECMAFGDHMNDYGMLLECGSAYVPENGYPPLKALIGQTVPPNTEGGVLKKLKEFLKEGEVT